MLASFPPFVDNQTEILILGTMPGAMSLLKQEYYAHKQNQFWKLLFTIFSTGIVPEKFEERVALLQQKHIGLWDVLANCERKGSLDIHIKNHVENDIPALLKQFPKIKKIIFNGKESHRYFMKKFGAIAGFTFYTMPSTSPAHTIKFEQKFTVWKEALLEN